MEKRALVAVTLCLFAFNCSSTTPSDPGGDTGNGGTEGGTGGKGAGGSSAKGGATGHGGTPGDGSGGSAKGGSAAGGAGDGGSGYGGASAGGSSGGDVDASVPADGPGTSEGGASGAPDAAPAAGGSSGSGSGCTGVTAKFCADFDGQDQMNGQPPKGAFTFNKGGYATMTVDNTQKYSGRQSMHIKLVNSPDSGYARLQFGAPLLPFASNDIHGRLMIFLTRNVKNHWDLVTAFASDKIDDSESVTQDTFGSYGTDGHIESVHQPGDDSVDSSTKFPVGRWACLQWEYKGDPAAHKITVKMDGQYIDKGMMMAKGSWKPATFKSLGIGWINFEGGVGGTIDMWIDDLALGEQEIPCPPAK
jgi:hypothetical protein